MAAFAKLAASKIFRSVAESLGKKLTGICNFFALILRTVSASTETAILLAISPALCPPIPSATKPVPVPKDEMDGILSKLGLIVKPKLEFNVGDKILVISGGFKDREFDIVNVNAEKEKVTVLTEMFGQSIETELLFSEIKKLDK